MTKYAVQIETQSFPMFASWLRAEGGGRRGLPKRSPRFSFRLEQSFDNIAEAEELATRVRGKVVEVERKVVR